MQDQTALRKELLFLYLPGDDGAPTVETKRIVQSFAHKHFRQGLIDDLFQAAYLGVITSIDRAILLANPRGYIVTAMRHTMHDAMEDDSFVPHPQYARDVKKLPRPQRAAPIYDEQTRTYREAIDNLEDRPHLNGQLDDICEGLSEDESQLTVWLSEGYGVGEIADKLGIAYQAANSRLIRLRRKLTLAREQGISYRLAVEIINRNRRLGNSRSRRSAGSASDD